MLGTRRPSVTLEDCCATQLTKVLPYLFMGGDQGAADILYLKSLGVTQILNCTVSCKNFFEAADCFQYTRVPLNDTADEDISPYFDATYRAIEAARQSKTAAYCHCKKGISRSSTIVIAYLMRHKSMSLIRSLELVKSCRLEASPQPAFMMQLAAYERQLFNGRCTLDVEKYHMDRFAAASQLRLNSTSPPSAAARSVARSVAKATPPRSSRTFSSGKASPVTVATAAAAAPAAAAVAAAKTPSPTSRGARAFSSISSAESSPS